MNTENRSINPTPSQPATQKPESNFPSGRALGGIIVVVVGTLLLAERVGADLPRWIFSWPMIPITIGLFIGARHKFRDWGWMIPVGIGLVFLIGEMIDGFDMHHFFWPIVIITVGLVMIFRSRRRHGDWGRWRNESDFSNTASSTQVESDFIDNVTIFGGAKKVIISKDFKGGEAVTIFGGMELNLTQADIQGRVNLELVQVFGGAKLVVPSNWKIHTEEVVCIFGGIDDKRNPNALTADPGKVLVLKGVCIFGGIDIKSY